MLIGKLKAMPAFRADAPPQIRHAIALFAIVWLVELGYVALILIISFRGLDEVPAAKTTLARQGFIVFTLVQAFWLFLNASLIVGLCQRQKLARMLELLLTLVTTIAFLAAAFPFRVDLLEVAFFANAIATVLIYSSACSRWFQGAAS